MSAAAGTKGMYVDVSPELKRKIGRRAADLDCSKRAVVIAALEMYLSTPVPEELAQAS